jgi:hypothetical protein
MATETSIERQRDIAGMVTRTTTTEAFTEIDDPSPGSNLRGWRISHSDGKYTLTTEQYESTSDAVVYAGDANTSSEAIETHPSLDGLTKDQRDKWLKWKQNPSDPTLGGFDPSTDTDPLIQKLFGWYSTGITTYLAPRITVKHTTIEDSAPSLDIIGNITSSAGGYSGNTGSRDFLITSVSFQQEGAKYRVTVEYLASQKGKTWDPTIYGV